VWDQKNKSAKSGKISKDKKRALSHHDPPQTHHTLTIKTPQQNTSFSATPMKKTPVKPQKPVQRAP
jgi:hypothetical protein